MGQSRSILLLQGPPSPFWRELAGAFATAGHRTCRVLLCPGDRLFWRGGPGSPRALSYQGSLADWPAWLRRLVEREGVTDILYYGDQQPYHRAAAALARETGIQATAVEFGYMRPGWITLERGGMGAWSHLPDDAGTIRRLASGLPDPPAAGHYAHGYGTEALAETLFAFANVFLRPLYPRYDRDRAMNPVLEYASTLLRWERQWRRRRSRDAALARAGSGEWPFMLVPLQLETDYQIRRNSPWTRLRDMIEAVIASFASHAPAELNLLFKVHPLDVGLTDWDRLVASVAAGHGVADRVATVDGGDLARLLAASRGVVLVNSTVGLHAIRAGRPVKTLGVAVYDMPGLTHQGPLSTFWTDPEPVDAALASDFVRVLAGTIQVPGSFYVEAGRRAAIAAIVERVAEGVVNGPAFVDPPPRLARALAMGVPA